MINFIFDSTSGDMDTLTHIKSMQSVHIQDKLNALLYLMPGLREPWADNSEAGGSNTVTNSGVLYNSEGQRS
jgi:hypothetical protein